MTPFTGVGLHGGFRGDAWFKHRIEIFKNYTLKSLLNQSNRNFIHWFSFRKEEENHPYVKELGDYMKSLNYRFIFTFDGLMYWDDKYTNYGLRTKLKNFLMMARDEWHNGEWHGLANIWKNTWEDKNRTLISRVESSLRKIIQEVGNDYEWVYLTRIDSDDMFHKESIALIQEQKPENRRSLVFKDGYILNIETGEVAEWRPPTNPPFHTIIFPSSIFFDSLSHVEYYRDFKTHEDATRVFTPVVLDMGKYMVSYHGKHISTAWDSPIDKKIHHFVKYGNAEPFKVEPKGYCYTTSGKNISTRWRNRSTFEKNSMIGEEFTDDTTRREILSNFGI